MCRASLADFDRYGVSLRIQSKCEKIRTRITPNTDTFYAVIGRLFIIRNNQVNQQWPDKFMLNENSTFNSIILKQELPWCIQNTVEYLK